jgi:hypothetical protein
MSIVTAVRRPQKRSGSGAVGESNKFVEVWDVRTDSLTESMVSIVTAPGIGYGAAHPDMADCKAMEWDLGAADDSGLWWAVSIRYYVPPPGKTIDSGTGLPTPAWSALGSTHGVPAYKDKDGVIIANSAGDPLEGLEAEGQEFGWSLVKAYPLSASPSWDVVVRSVANKVNSDTWSGETARKWKCSFKGAQKKTIVTQSGTTQTAVPYWEVAFEFRFKDETWDLAPWDIGFNQRADSSGAPAPSGTNRVTILGKDQRPVKQPVALSSGIALAPGTAPTALNFRYYQETAFTSKFGVPS